MRKIKSLTIQRFKGAIEELHSNLDKCTYNYWYCKRQRPTAKDNGQQLGPTDPLNDANGRNLKTTAVHGRNNDN